MTMMRSIISETSISSDIYLYIDIYYVAQIRKIETIFRNNSGSHRTLFRASVKQTQSIPLLSVIVKRSVSVVEQ